MSYSNVLNLKEIKNKKVLFLDLETTGIIKTPRGIKPEEVQNIQFQVKLF